MKLIHYCLFSTFLIFSSALHAGARGHVMAFIDISPPPYVDGKANMIALRKLEKLEGKEDCWACAAGERSDWGISILYVKKLPDGIRYEGVKAAIAGDKAAKKTLEKVLGTFKDKKDGAMLDGLYAYEHTAKSLTIYVISPVAGYKIDQLGHTINRATSLKDILKILDDLLEKTAAKIPFSP
jgi:hypothetical protein